VLLQIERVKQRGQTGSVSVGGVVDMNVDVSTDDDRSTLQHQRIMCLDEAVMTFRCQLKCHVSAISNLIYLKLI